MEKVVSTKEKRIQAIKEDFKNHGFNPEIVNRISTWGEIERRKEGFYLNIQNLEGEVIAGFEYHWSDGRLILIHDLPHVHESTVVVDMFGLRQMFFDNITGRLHFKADFGRIGKHAVWINKHGQFKVESSVGKESPLRT